MNPAMFCVSLAILLVGEVSLTQAQAPKQKSPPTADAKSRFSDEAIEFFRAITPSYELNGKLISAAPDPAVMVRAAGSKDPKIQDLGRRACRQVYLFSLLRKQKADPEIVRIVTADGFKFLREELDKFVNGQKGNAKPEELKNLENGIKGLKAVVDGDGKTLETVIYTEPQKEANRVSLVRLIAQGQGQAMKEKMRALVGEPTTPLPAAKDPIQVKLESKDKVAVMAFTNQTTSPLHHCLVFTRAVNDPVKVDKSLQGNLVKHALAAGVFGASTEAIDAAATGIFLQAALRNLERGGALYIPEIPAGGTVRVPLMSASDMFFVKSTELSLWCDELTVESVSGPGQFTLTALQKKGAAPKKDATTSPSDGETDSVTRVTVDHVEYVYQGAARNGLDVFVTVLATSKKGDRPAPRYAMILIDAEGEKYRGMRVKEGGIKPSLLREGVPVKLIWRFGPDAFGKKSSAPSAKITQFAAVIIETTVTGRGNTIEFRQVPTVLKDQR